MTRLVILDRDGVINSDHKGYVNSPDEWQPIPGSLEAIAAMKSGGLKLAVATNQSGIARNFYTEQDLMAIHNKMEHLLEQLGAKIDVIAFCPHGPDDGCACRKPKPGMLRQISRDLGIAADESIFIGDSLKDIEAAIAHGCRPILVQTGNGLRTAELLKQQQLKVEVEIFADLASASEHILSDINKSGNENEHE